MSPSDLMSPDASRLREFADALDADGDADLAAAARQAADEVDATPDGPPAPPAEA